MSLETIQTINNPAFKTGVGKNGKPWTMMQITTDKNNMASVFAPANIGDKVEMTWNDQYGNWSAKKVNAQEAAQLEALRKMYELNLAIYKAVTGETYGKKTEVVAPKPTSENPAPGFESQKGNPYYPDGDGYSEPTEEELNSIPF